MPRAVATPIGGGAVIGGVARDLGLRTGIDPLWFRLAFVGLTAFTGLGVVLYIAAWLFLRGQRRSPISWLYILGAIVVVGGFIVVGRDAGWSYLTVPGRSLSSSSARPSPCGSREQPPGKQGSGQPRRRCCTDAAASRGKREPREPSYLRARDTGGRPAGRGSGGDRLPDPGDELHPERWLGAAAAVCGAGMVIGAWRGRALWLVLPGLLFAASGFLAGHAARAGVDDFAVGSRDFWTGSPTDGLPVREDLVAGAITVTIDELRRRTRAPTCASASA